MATVTSLMDHASASVGGRELGALHRSAALTAEHTEFVWHLRRAHVTLGGLGQPVKLQSAVKDVTTEEHV